MFKAANKVQKILANQPEVCHRVLKTSTQGRILATKVGPRFSVSSLQSHSITAFPQRMIFSGFFTAPVMKEREERINLADAEKILSIVKAKKDAYTFKEACNAMNDLSYVLLPFDKNGSDFNLLQTKIRKHLKSVNLLNQQVDSKDFYVLLEGLHRLKNYSLDAEVGEVILAGNYGRTAKEIAVSFLHFALANN